MRRKKILSGESGDSGTGQSFVPPNDVQQLLLDHADPAFIYHEIFALTVTEVARNRWPALGAPAATTIG